MKKYLLLLTCFTAQSEQLLQCNGTSQNILYPLNYDEAFCEMSLAVDVNGTVQTEIIMNEPNCGTRQLNIVFDGHLYVNRTDILFSFTNGQSGTLWVKEELDNCGRANNGTISQGIDTGLIGTSFFFGITSESINYVVRENESFLFFNSIDGDIICDNGIQYSDIIFTSSFE